MIHGTGRAARRTPGIAMIAVMLVAAAMLASFAAGCGNGDEGSTGEDSAREPSREEVAAFVDEAVEYAEENGKEKALAEFTDQNGEFTRGDLYIYAYDFSGTVLAHGGDPSLVGQDLIDYEDPNGVKVIQKLVEIARDQGSGWLSYTWENPETGQQEPKQGYVVKVDDTWFLGSGTYE